VSRNVSAADFRGPTTAAWRAAVSSILRKSRHASQQSSRARHNR
jgi:hypothetical protein